MEFIIIFFIALALAMDAFAVSLAYGSAVIQHTPENTFKVAGFFGGFQAVMPLLGWFLGERFLSYISGFDHWVAFFLLVLVSGRMIYEAFKESELKGWFEPMKFGILLGLSVAVSIDALITGISFSFLRVSVFLAVLIIGIVTFSLSLIGIYAGRSLGQRFRRWARFFGGIMLIVIATKILIEHL